MKPRYLLASLALTVPRLLLSAADTGDNPAAYKTAHILFFSKSSGWEHEVIRDPAVVGRPINKSGGNEVPGLAFQVLRELGAKDKIEFVFSKDGSLFTPEYLARFDAYFFYTSGDLSKAGTDGNPPITAEGKKALLEAIAGGKGFVGAHSASDSYHSPGGELKTEHRFLADGDNTDPYLKMLGGEFIMHGQQQLSHLAVVDPRFPGVVALAPDNRIYEEWYSLKNFSDDLHVILLQDTAGMTGFLYARPSYPSTWIHMYGKGRVFYTSLGHRDDTWNSAMYQSLLAGAINWAVGRVDADVTPNLKDVAPGAGVLPIYQPPAASK
jgi:type 1 glutamine amidotransferase